MRLPFRLHLEKIPHHRLQVRIAVVVPSSIRNCLTSAVLTALGAAAQERAHPPRFEDYPVTPTFKGTPAAPVLLTPNQRLYRTRIREGVANGVGVLRDGVEQPDNERPGPSFAGHYIVVAWGCGSLCQMMAVIDAATGRVYNPPLSKDLDTQNLYDGRSLPSPAQVEFRLDSALMIVKANPDPSKVRTNYVHYFLWENNQWKLLRRIPIEPSER